DAGAARGLHMADVENVAIDPDLAAARTVDVRHGLGIVRRRHGGSLQFVRQPIAFGGECLAELLAGPYAETAAQSPHGTLTDWQRRDQRRAPQADRLRRRNLARAQSAGAR